MNTEEVALKLVELCRKGEWMEAVNSLYADEIVSVEPRAMGGNAGGDARARGGAR